MGLGLKAGAKAESGRRGRWLRAGGYSRGWIEGPIEGWGPRANGEG